MARHCSELVAATGRESHVEVAPRDDRGEDRVLAQARDDAAGDPQRREQAEYCEAEEQSNQTVSAAACAPQIAERLIPLREVHLGVGAEVMAQRIGFAVELVVEAVDHGRALTALVQHPLAHPQVCGIRRSDASSARLLGRVHSVTAVERRSDRARKCLIGRHELTVQSSNLSSLPGVKALGHQGGVLDHELQCLVGHHALGQRLVDRVGSCRGASRRPNGPPADAPDRHQQEARDRDELPSTPRRGE